MLQLVTDVGLEELCIDSGERFLPVLHWWSRGGKKNVVFIKEYLRIIKFVAFIGMAEGDCVKTCSHKMTRS